jgi:cell division protein FtsI/penicillin-binding protein 2
LRLARAYRALWQQNPGRISGGKTGTTAQAAWYAGWAPVDQPRIVVAVMTGGRGATDAQPAAQELIARWLR